MQSPINFMIVAHVDHGKSTLSSKILSYCSGKDFGIETLDNLDVEKQRGITVRSTYVSFKYDDKIFNLMDTPGHADFKHQLRLLFKYMHCAVLLVDITQGVQCQTVNNYLEIKKAEIPYVIAVSKIDMLDDELVQIAMLEIAEYFQVPINEIVVVDYRKQDSIPKLLNRVSVKKSIRDFTNSIVILDLFKNPQSGWVFLIHTNINIKINDTLYITDKVYFKVNSIYRYNNIEVPFGLKNDIMYIKSGYRGDIEHRYLYLSYNKGSNREIVTPNTVLWSMLYPEKSEEIGKLINAANLLHQNDYTFTYKFMTTDTVGHGLLCGFHGSLHKEVILDRLKQEHYILCLTTPPLIEYRAYLYNNPDYLKTLTPNDINQPIKKIDEPFINMVLVIPNRYIDELCSIIKLYRGNIDKNVLLPGSSTLVMSSCPLYHAVNGLDDELMKRTNGYVNISYNDVFYVESDLKPLVFKAHNTIINTCSLYAHKSEARNISNKILEILKNNMSREQFHFNIYAIWGNENIKSVKIQAYRKDTLVKVTGLSRVKKVLERQKRGKKLLKEKGVIRVNNKEVLNWFIKKH